MIQKNQKACILELSIQKGHLNVFLKFVLNLWIHYKTMDGMQMSTLSREPLTFQIHT